MKNTSRSNLEYQSEVILDSLENNVDLLGTIHEISISDLESIKEQIEGLIEIKVALTTLTN